MFLVSSRLVICHVNIAISFLSQEGSRQETSLQRLPSLSRIDYFALHLSFPIFRTLVKTSA